MLIRKVSVFFIRYVLNTKRCGAIKMKPDIDIICPKCERKAAFYAPSVVLWTRVVPDINGKVICSSCGLNKDYQFDSKDYYYSIPIGSRFLYARTIDKLKDLLTYFKEDKRLKGDPELDSIWS